MPFWLGLAVAAQLGAENQAEQQLGQGITAYRAHNLAGTVQTLRAAQSQLPKLSDYIAYHLGSAEEQSGDLDSAIRDLSAYRQNPVSASPFAGKISLVLAKALTEKRQPASTSQAIQVIQNDYKILPQPDGDFVLAMAYEAQSEAVQAAMVYQRVYYSYPNTTQAAEAWTAMERLRVSMGSNFPRATARQQLERCEKWIAAKEYYKARQEYESLTKSLPEPELDDAKVGVGAAEYLAGDASSASRYLRGLHVAKSESDAQRLYYLTEAARKNGDDTEMMVSVKALSQKYPKSVWRLKALVTAGNRYLLTNDRDKYAPLYKAASDTFPDDNSTAYCHWKFTWDAYLGGKAESADLLREQIERYPGDSRASTALYFLGRIAEQKGLPAEALSFYTRLSEQYPHYFYGVLARQRIAQAKLHLLQPSKEINDWLAVVDWPLHKDLSASEPNAATKQRIDRARLLLSSSLPDLAEAEIRYGAKLESEQPQLLALEMARSADSPFRALRLMKSFSADYLSLPIENAPRKFWQMLFPLPYKEDVFRYARAKGLDPYSVAALIRQESEFNPSALSHARAYGLMQLVPSTGRMVGRQEGVRVATATALFNPGLNIQLGTHYLRDQLDMWSGKWEQTLAAYNAGPGRVKEWLSWGSYREPPEFVESIPFTETREYVQAVLRNADMYRQIYGTSANTETSPMQMASKEDLVPEYGAVSKAPAPALALAGDSAGTARHSAVTAKPFLAKNSSRAGIRRVSATRRNTVKSRKVLAAAKKSSRRKHA